MKTKIIHLIFILSILVFLIKCNTIKNTDLVGEYVLETQIGKEYIRLNNDSTFYFNSEIPFVQSESSGHWSFKKNALTIKSNPKFKNDYIEVEEILNNEKSIIEIVDGKNKGIYGAIININGSDNNYITDIEGVVYLKENNLRKGDLIKISTINLSPEKSLYKIKSISNKNYIRITIYPKENHKKYYEDDTLKIKNRNIILNGQKYKKIDNHLNGNSTD